MRVFWLFLSVILLTFGTERGLAKALNVVTSIRPVHSLVSAVMGETGAPYLVLQGNNSAHLYALTTSDAEALQNADIVFWVGADLETFLGRSLATLNSSATNSALVHAPGLMLYPVRESGAWESHRHEHDADEHGDEDHDEDHDDARHGDDHAHEPDAPIDMHIWLDPKNAAAMTEEIARVLATADPDRAALYRRNAATLRERLAVLETEMASRLEPLAARPFIQFHDAFQYLEKRVGLGAAGAVTLDPEHQPSAKRIASIRQRIRDAGAVCLFTEPQFPSRLADVIVEGLAMGTASLDPLGAGIKAGPDLYFRLMARNTNALVSCLSEPTGN